MSEAHAAVDWRDSRRLTGPNLLLEGPGAGLEVALPAGREDELAAAWQVHARAMLAAVGWPDATTAVRRFPGGASFAISAPLDGLYAATLIAEDQQQIVGLGQLQRRLHSTGLVLHPRDL